MPIASGRRIHDVTVQNPTTAANSDGGFTTTYASLTPSTLRVAIEPATASRLERLTAGTAIAGATHIVTGPYHAGVTTQTRLTFGSRYLYVVGVSDPEERHRETIMVCTEVKP